MRAFLIVVLLCPLGASARAEDDPVARHLELAARLQTEGQTPESIMELRSALFALPPGDRRRVDLEERVGMAFLSEGDVPAAHEAFVETLRSAKELRVKNESVADAVAGIGFCLEREADAFARASDYLRRALALGPSPALRPRIERELARLEALLPFDPALEDVGPDFRVDRIVFVDNYTDEDVLRERLPFKEGSTINAREIAAAKRALDAMDLFKSVFIATAPAPSGVGAQVTITVKDGWYVLPFPVALFGAGGRRGGVVLEERNLRRRAEAFDLAILSGESGHRVSFGASQNGWSARLINERRGFTENRYADGGFGTTPGLGRPLDQNDPGRFGLVADSYTKRSNHFILSVEGPLPWPRFFGEAGFDRNNVGYAAPSPSVPGDNDRKEGNAFAALKYGAPDFRTPGLGSILGFGLSDLEDKLKPPPRPRFVSSGEIRWIQARKWTASSVPYGIGLVRWQTTYTWGAHQSATLAVAAGHGYSLPPAQMLPTGRLSALQGLYAREFRGDSIGGASLSYSRRLWPTRVGYFQAGGFIEDARAWFHPLARDKQGVGVTAFYRFWRFPIPLGVSYTYSVDDRDSELAAGVGGRF